MASGIRRRGIYLPKDVADFMDAYSAQTGVPKSKMVDMSMREVYRKPFEAIQAGTFRAAKHKPAPVMGRNSIRQGVSLTKEVYELIDRYTEATGDTITGMVETAIRTIYAAEIAEMG